MIREGTKYELISRMARFILKVGGTFARIHVPWTQRRVKKTLRDLFLFRIVIACKVFPAKTQMHELRSSSIYFGGGQKVYEKRSKRAVIWDHPD